MIDAGEARLVHSTFEPHISSNGCRWAGDGTTLEIDVQAQITVKGQTLGDKLTPLGFTCTTPGVTGKRGFEVVPGQPVPPTTVWHSRLIDYACRQSFGWTSRSRRQGS